ncbi:hypothetical protein HMPREF2600_11440 [Neisseria sp. HMSC077D05]|nr:hypothetical protein HMPREF2600_11440 [Neisseria sp. HMSC077D05]
MDKTENLRFSSKGRLKTAMTSFCLLSDDLPIVQTKIRLGTHYGGATLKFQVKVFLVYLRFSALNENTTIA